MPKHGAGKNIMEWLKVDGDIKLTDLTLGTRMEGKPTTTQIESLALEENGPIKAVVKITGSLLLNGSPVQDFILRLRFFKDLNTFEVVHTLVIREALGIEGVYLSAQAPLAGNPWNRHISLVGEDGVYTEAAQLLISRRHWKNNALYHQQVNGEVVKISAADEEMLRHAKENAIWNNFDLVQGNHRSYRLTKQTQDGYAPIDIGYGSRAKGVVAIGGINGSVGVGVENFWQKAPRQLEIRGLNQASTTMTIWLWSPHGGTMDFSHYSKRDHMLSAYEGMEEIRSTPVGIANTNTVTFKFTQDAITSEELLAFATEITEPKKIVATPKDYYQTQVFGVWSLPQRTTTVGNFLEDQMVYLREFYVQEIEQRDWYGFWNYGDVMHTYDADRHVWRYDLGGYAWQNTELVPNIWLWQDFLRTGDVSAFKLAEAMTKHTADVDQYHLGEYQGLGSRHNVLHWGCQCKEARISAAGLHRYYYYLTGDERIGDLLTAVKDNENQIFDELAPLREFYPEKVDDKYPIRVGPDWSSLCSNWFTEWERTGNPDYLAKIETGLKTIKQTPYGLMSGPTYLFDKATKEMNYIGDNSVGGYHMIISFGAPQYWLEIAENTHDEELKRMLAEFGRHYAYTPEEKAAHSNGLLVEGKLNWPMFATGLMGYAAKYFHEERFAHHAWDILLHEELGGIPLPVADSAEEVTIFKTVKELPWISTNCVSQWCLNVIMCLEFISEYLPAENKK